MSMDRTFKCGFNAKLTRILVIFAPLYLLWTYSFHSSPTNDSDFIMFCLAMFIFSMAAVGFQHDIPLEIKTNEEGMTIRRWKKEKFYAWKDVKILLITKILFPLGRFDLHLLSEPFHKRYLMILGLNRKQRKELMQIVKQGIESYKGCS